MTATVERVGARPRVFEAVETLVEDADGALVLGRDDPGDPAVAFVPASEEVGSRERARLRELAGPGIPEPADGPGGVVVLPALTGARPLRRWGAVPVPAVRAATVTLLSALSHVHSKGLVHGALAQGWIVADESGGFWIAGWSRAREPERSPEFAESSDAVGNDLADLGRALLRATLGSAPEDGTQPAPDECRAATSRIAATDRELARVLTRLSTTDPREAYGGASEALSDLGERDLSLPEPWEEIPAVGIRRHVRFAMNLLDRSDAPAGRVASLDFVGGPGSGRTRLLREIARAARERRAIVFTGEGRVTSQGFGALGVLARQLAAHVPPESPVRARHADFLGLLHEGGASPARATAEEGGGLVGPLVDLVRAATSGGAAVLAIDDAHLLPRAAADAWRALGRYVDAVGDAEGPLRVLLVTTCDAVPEPEPGVRRERRDLADWGRVHVHSLLSRILTEPGAAAVLAADVHRLAGGRPLEVVETLRDLERRGALVPAGRKWKWIEGQHALEATTAADRVRRALEAVGRDGTDVAQAVAVAGRLRLHRDEIAELVGVPPHRVQPAAEAGVRAGLLVRDGAGWRVRAESLRRRVEAAMTDERRRGLHREIVARLLESRPDDLAALALHARRGGDPRARDWTRAAAAELRAAGSAVEAAEHLEEAVAESGLGAGPDGWRDLVVVADTLVDAGVTARVEALVDGLLGDPRFPPERHADALLVKARALRIANRFHALSELVLPPAGAAAALSKLRYYRAAGLAMIGRRPEAEREMRLAAAEAPGAADADDAHYEELQAEHLLAFASGRRDDAHRHLIALLRHPRARASRFDQARFLLARANLCRLQSDFKRAVRWIRSVRRIARSLGSPPELMSLLETNEGIILSDLSRRDAGVRAFERAAVLALRAGDSLSVGLTRLRLAAERFASLRYDHDDFQYVLRLGSSIHTAPDSVVVAVWERLSFALLYCSLQEQLESLATRVPRDAARLIRDRVAVGRMVLDLDGAEQQACDWAADPEPADAHSNRVERETDSTESKGNYVLAGAIAFELRAPALAWKLRRSLVSDQLAPRKWITEVLTPVVRELASEGWEGSDLILSALLVAEGADCHALRTRIFAAMGASTVPVPPATEWRRDLATAVMRALKGHLAAARKAVTKTYESITALEREWFGGAGAESACRAREFANRVLSGLSPLLTTCRTPAGRLEFVTRHDDSTRLDACLSDFWAKSLGQVRQSQCVVATGRGIRELLRFAGFVIGDRSDALLVRDSTDLTAVGKAPAIAVLVAVDLWTVNAALSVIRWLQAVPVSTQIVVLLSSSARDARALSSGHRAIIERGAGVLVCVPSPTEVVSMRVRTFEGVLRESVDEGAVEGRAAEVITGYEWPGGLGEMEIVVAELRRRGVSRVSYEALLAVGWDERRALGEASPLPELEGRIVAALAKGGSAGVRELSAATGKPTRTVLRAICELIESGELERTGRARATRYRIRKARE